ncbi:hypothetical protein [Gordonibacter massiliensis (ex Traore et al. 2017)]|nr:hypothetical protein [Gordonibacter massiliensis (ex Traore et al. 2017)]
MAVLVARAVLAVVALAVLLDCLHGIVHVPTKDERREAWRHR